MTDFAFKNGLYKTYTLARLTFHMIFVRGQTLENEQDDAETAERTAGHLAAFRLSLIDTLVDIIDGLHTRICNLEEAQKPADPGHLSGISEAVAAEIAEGISQGNALRA